MSDGGEQAADPGAQVLEKARAWLAIEAAVVAGIPVSISAYESLYITLGQPGDDDGYLSAVVDRATLGTAIGRAAIALEPGAGFFEGELELTGVTSETESAEAFALLENTVRRRKGAVVKMCQCELAGDRCKVSVEGYGTPLTGLGSTLLDALANLVEQLLSI